MKKLWLVLVMIFASCATPVQDPPTAQKPLLTPRKTLVATPLATVHFAKPTKAPVRPVGLQWLSLAEILREKTQLAIAEKPWEDQKFKKEAYQICEQMIAVSEGKVQDDSKEILKRFRWGVEFMDIGQLQEVIRIIDQYN